MLVSLVAVAGALRPDPGQARSWVERELLRPEYQRSLTDRFLSWLGDLWDSLTQAALGASPLSTGAAALVAVTVAVLVVVVAGRLRREPTPRPEGAGPLLLHGASPDDHRAAATGALAEGRDDLALVEAFRALASRSLQRGLLDARPGLTAHELAGDLAPVFPAHAAALSRAAALFDLVFYGDQPAGAADARSVLDLDDALRLARPSTGAAHDGRPASAVPR